MRNPTARLLAIAALTSALAAQQQIVLPDNHHLCESATQLGNVGSTNWWRTSAGRFQVIYEASHFLNAGVTGPITITHVRFRGEDDERNSGGQVYSGVTVELGSTTVNTTTMSATFGTNRVPVGPDTTTMGPLGTTTVTLAPSVGSVPNNWNIDIDLGAIGAAFTFDPNGAEPNLLIELNMPTAPANAAPLALVGTQDTTGGVAIVRGRGVYAGTAGAASGTSSTAPPVVGLEFAGPGGYSTIIPSRNEFYGAACGGAPSTFYQAFLNGQPWDLGTGLTLTPDNPLAPTVYTVSAGAAPVDLTQVNAAANSVADDAIVTHTLGFTFPYPGGSTPTIIASTNGFVWLDATMTASDFSPQVVDLLGSSANYGARLALYWHDLNCGRNTGLNPQAGLHVRTDSSGGPGNNVAYATYWDIGEFNTVSGTGIFGHTVWTMQVAMYEATGVVEFRYGAMPPFVAASTATAGSNPGIIGFSQGRIGGAAGIPSVDPQSRDLSFEVPFTTFVEGLTGHMGQTAVATPVAGGPQYAGRLFGGQSVTWNVSNVPAGALIGAQLLDVAASMPGLQLLGITAPGCLLSVTPSALLWEVTFFPPASVAGTVPLVVAAGYNPAILGTDIYAQYVLLDGLFTGAELISASSNALAHTVGLQ